MQAAPRPEQSFKDLFDTLAAQIDQFRTRRSQLDASRQLGLFARVADALQAATRWLLRQSGHGAIADTVRHYRAGVDRLVQRSKG